MSSADAVAGTTSTSRPRAASWRMMSFFIPRSIATTEPIRSVAATTE